MDKLSLLLQLESTVESLQQQIALLKEELLREKEPAAKAEEPAAEPVTEPAAEPVDFSDFTEDDIPDDLPEPSAQEPLAQTDFADVTVVEQVEEVPSSPAPAPAPDPAPDPAPEIPPAPKRVLQYQWQKDLPGLPVKDIRSAIALNDRVLYINSLFGQNPILFQETLTALNAVSSLEAAEAYVTEHFPQWDLNSEVVFRFMMAVRRKLR